MWWTALLLGLAGSLHCAGMCSPLAMAVINGKPFLLSSILYNGGRVFIYSLLGILAASFGTVLHLTQYQQIVSILLGSIFLLIGVGGSSTMNVPYLSKGVALFTVRLKQAFGSILHKKSLTVPLILGMLNGLLPCGLTYLALTACLILPAASDGFLFMIYFGLGTWPVMIGLTKLWNIARLKNIFKLTYLSRVTMVAIGILLLLRVWWVHPHLDNFSIVTANKEVICK